MAASLPCPGFLGEEDYEAVCDRMRLADGTLWPMPIVLDITEEKAAELGAGANLALRDPEGVMLAVLHVSELYRPDLSHEVKRVYGSTDKAHPGVAYVLDKVNPVYVAGQLEVVGPARPLRLQDAPVVPGPVALPLLRVRVGEGRRFPDPQPHAPRPRGADLARRPPGRGEPPHPPFGGHDQAG